jgi:hypothetical protein
MRVQARKQLARWEQSLHRTCPHPASRGARGTSRRPMGRRWADGQEGASSQTRRTSWAIVVQ